MSLFAELRRRNVFRVAVAYSVTAWLVAQVAELALENFGAPEWVMKTLLLFLALGLPLAIVFAWAFELTPEGLRREKDVDRSQSITEQTGKKLNYTIIAVLASALVITVVTHRWNDDTPTQKPIIDEVHRRFAVRQHVGRQAKRIFLRWHFRGTTERARQGGGAPRRLANLVVFI